MARAAVVASLLLGLASAAHADTLYKCVDASGLIAIQNEPCPKGQTQVWARDSEPEPPPTPEQLAEQQVRREHAEAAARERLAAEMLAQRQAEEAEKARAAERPQAPPPPPGPPGPPGADKPPPASERDARCDAAKAFTQSLRDKPWLGLDDAQWQRVYGWMIQQCK